MEIAALADITKPPLRADGQIWQELLERPEKYPITMALLNSYFADALVSSERGGNAWTEFVQRTREHQDEHVEAMVLMKPYLGNALNAAERKAFAAHIRECPDCHDKVVVLEISDSIDKKKLPPGNQPEL